MRSPNSVDPMLYKADLNLYSGILKYLSVLERYGDATLTYDGRILKMDVGFVFKFLQVTYNYILKMGLFDLNGRILATTKDVRSKISVMFNTTEYTLGLNKLEIQTPGRIKVILKNKNGGTDWINTAIANIIIPFLQSTITSNVQIQATNAIRMYFNEINRIIVPHKVFPGIFENQLLKCT
ncbi:hypothetical protein X777_01370 [Ooceraea biroi]|uniref:Circadian clock-controlled protein n=1 Tax=Ooceraea biroi TaxID=2015173 RepID=A0A026WR14_OOCBI|nr:hypothetical protein X777_01370 [Ooceraea biroi]